MITKFSRPVTYHVTWIERFILRYFSRMFEFTRGLRQVKHPFELLHGRIVWIEREPKVSSWRSGSILHVDCGDLVRLVSKVEAVSNHDMWCCLHIHICRGRMQKRLFILRWQRLRFIYFSLLYFLTPLGRFFFINYSYKLPKLPFFHCLLGSGCSKESEQKYKNLSFSLSCHTSYYTSLLRKLLSHNFFMARTWVLHKPLTTDTCFCSL